MDYVEIAASIEERLRVAPGDIADLTAAREALKGDDLHRGCGKATCRCPRLMRNRPVPGGNLLLPGRELREWMTEEPD
jgi:hypothetical protein